MAVEFTPTTNRLQPPVELSPYLTVRTQFVDENKRPRQIKTAVFKVLDGASLTEVPVKQHHIPYVNYPSQGWVQADIDTSSLTPNKEYIFRFEITDVFGGYYSSESRTTLFEQSRVQWLIDQLRTILMDRPSFSQWMPQHLHQRYLIRKPWEVEWQNDELFNYLNMALGDINNATPPTLQFTLETCPAVSFLLKGGMIYALMGRGLVEVYNYYTTNAPVQVQTYKGDKFSDFMKWLQNEYKAQIETWKKAYAIYESGKPKALVLTKLPFTVVRPLSMMYGYGNLYQW